MTIMEFRDAFPALKSKVYGRSLVYLDNAASTQLPASVLDAMQSYYIDAHANAHRSGHYRGARATEMYEEARVRVAAFLNAESSDEIIFTQGATDGINLLAEALRDKLDAGSQIIVSGMEHHSNYLPWAALCRQTGAEFVQLPSGEDGRPDLSLLDGLLNERVKLLCVCHVSNLTGAVLPVKDIVEKARRFGVPVLVDGAQAVSHLKVDVRELGCDYYCFSGHKLFGPMGIGVLYGKRASMEGLPPARYGGGMVRTALLPNVVYEPMPHCFEAGTSNVAGAIGLAEAIRFLDLLGWEELEAHEETLLSHALTGLCGLEGINMLRVGGPRAGIISFAHERAHSQDIAALLDKLGIAVRSGSHCAQPLLKHLGYSGVVRLSLAAYNTLEEIDVFLRGMEQVLNVLTGYSGG